MTKYSARTRISLLAVAAVSTLVAIGLVFKYPAIQFLSTFWATLLTILWINLMIPFKTKS